MQGRRGNGNLISMQESQPIPRTRMSFCLVAEGSGYETGGRNL